MRLDTKHDALTFRLNGDVPVRIHWTFAVPIVLPFLFEWSRSPLDALRNTSILGALLFAAIFLHEFEHFRSANRHGIRTERIELFLFGGLTRFKAPGPGPHPWGRIAFAGPLTNIALAVVFAAAYRLVFGSFVPLAPTGDLRLLLYPSIGLTEWTLRLGVWLNVFLAALNLLPAYPLDGGTIAHQLLLQRFGARRSAQIVGTCGVILSILRFAIILPAAVAGFLFWIPPSFRPNWIAIRGSRKSRRAPRSSENIAETVEWRGKGGRRINK